MLVFNIEKQPLWLHLSSGVPKKSGFSALWNPKTEKISGVITDNTDVVSHLEALDRVESAFIELGEKVETMPHILKDGRLFYNHYKIEREMDVTPNEDEGVYILYPEVIMYNSYDGFTTSGLEFGIVINDLHCRVQTLPKKNISLLEAKKYIQAFLGEGMGYLYNKLVDLQNDDPASAAERISTITKELSNKDLKVLSTTIDGTFTSWPIFIHLLNLINRKTSYRTKRQLEFSLAKAFDLYWSKSYE